MKVKLLPYEKAGRVVRLLSVLQLVAALGIVIAIVLPDIHSPTPSFSIWHHIILFSLATLIPSALFYLGASIMKHKPWSRAVGIAYGVILLMGFPIGTLIGAYILWCLVTNWELPPVVATS